MNADEITAVIGADQAPVHPTPWRIGPGGRLCDSRDIEVDLWRSDVRQAVLDAVNTLAHAARLAQAPAFEMNAAMARELGDAGMDRLRAHLLKTSEDGS